jgi:hypothetical protein
MRRLLMILPIVTVLAACTDAPQPVGIQQGITAGFSRGGVANVIYINALDSLPLRAANLVAADGTTTPSSYLNVDAAPQSTGGQAAFDDPYRNSLLGTNAMSPLTNQATVRSENRLLLMVSKAEITLADPVAYRRDWQTYHIRLTFAGGAEPDVREIPAPAPPPER